MKLRLLLLLLATYILTGCNSGVFNSPTNVVRAKYDALSKNDQAAYLETVVPDTRQQIGAMNVLANAMVVSFISLDPLDMNVGGWMDSIAGMRYSYRDMRYEIVEQYDDYALIQATGKLDLGGFNFTYCMYQDVRNINGTWYNDEFSDKKKQRMPTLLDKQMQRLNSIAGSVGVDPFFGSADLAMLMDPRLWEILFDLC